MNVVYEYKYTYSELIKFIVDGLLHGIKRRIITKRIYELYNKLNIDPDNIVLKYTQHHNNNDCFVEGLCAFDDNTVLTGIELCNDSFGVKILNGTKFDDFIKNSGIYRTS